MFDVTTESTPAAHALRAKMRAFHDSITNYDAFAETNDLPGERAERGDALGA